MIDSIYDVLYASTGYARERNALQFDWLMRRDLTGVRSALDLGCGVGHVVRALRARGVRAVGVDGSSALQDRAWAGDPDFVRGDLVDVRLGETVDLVVCHDVLEHLPEAATERAFETMARHARGCASITVADHADVWLGTELHVTRRPFAWWRERLEAWFDVLEAESTLGGALHLYWCRPVPLDALKSFAAAPEASSRT